MPISKNKPSSTRTKLTIMLYPEDRLLLKKAGSFIGEKNFDYGNLSPSQLIRILLRQASVENIAAEHIETVLSVDRRRAG